MYGDKPAGGVGPSAPRDAFNNHSFCQRCSDHKPPNAHHCRVCKECVTGMDHHCPFIRNCVGTDNMRHFILFITWTIASCIYVAGMASYLVYRRWEVAHGVMMMVMNAFEWRRTFTVVVSALYYAPVWLSTSVYLAVVSTALVLGLSTLLYRQLQLVLQGVSYIDAMKLQTQGYSPGMAGSPMANMQRVFGSRHPFMWPLPYWGAPPQAVTSKKKT